jgi:hypothetical protein
VYKIETTPKKLINKMTNFTIYQALLITENPCKPEELIGMKKLTIGYKILTTCK